MPEIEELASNYDASSFCLSGLSQALILAGIAVLEDLAQWVGADGYDLTDAEKETIDNIVGDASAEINAGEACLMFAMPAGTMVNYGGATIPSFWLDCAGQSLLRTDYPELFAAIGTTWGNVDSTHFTLPDTRGRTIIGAGTGTGLTARTLAASGGEENHTLTIPELPTHSHRINVHNNGSTGTETTVPASGNAVVNQQPTTENTGSNTPHNNMQPFKVTKIIIYTGKLE